MIVPTSAVTQLSTAQTTGPHPHLGLYGSSTIANAPAGNMKVTAALQINGVNLEDFMKSVSERLCILTPNPAKLEKYEALRIAYKNYKLLESLLDGD